jgi:RNA polymerase sigma-70 factor (ECF subfamily)
MYKDKNYKEVIKNLVEQCLGRDAEAWNRLIKLLSPLMVCVISEKFKRLGFRYQKSDIENLKQDILLSIWEGNKLKTIKDREKTIPWICVFTSNVTSNYIRSLKPNDLPNADLLDDSIKSSSPMPLDEMSNNEMRDNINSALESLNCKERVVIKLLLLYGKKYKEIAQILNIPLSTALVYGKRAKFKLKERLKKYVIK